MAVTYESWRSAVFGQAPDSDPVLLDLPEAVHVPPRQLLDYIEAALLDPEVHQLFSPEQIAIGLQLLYHNSCSDMVFSYLDPINVDRSAQAVGNLRHLYRNYFERYCCQPVTEIGNDDNGRMGYVCYMFWDVFIVYPGNAPPSVIAAGISVMADALRSECDAVQASALHGLGHWCDDLPAIPAVIDRWLQDYPSANPALREYAEAARTGCIQ